MKFEKTDLEYFKRRKKFSEKYGQRELWSVIDHWPLYCGIGNLARSLSIFEIFKQTLDVPGHVAEFGSWRGANLLFMAKLLKIFDPHSDKRVYCFDSFEGLTAFSDKDKNVEKKKKGENNSHGLYQGSHQELTDALRLYDMEDDIVITKGLIEKTLPFFMKEQAHLAFSFIYCDTDLYDSTHKVLEQMHPRLSKGGVFIFDEWNHDLYPGEGIAVDEFLKKHSDEYEVLSIRNTRQPSLYMRKLRA